MKQPTLSELATSFAKFAEPSDTAFNLAVEIEHVLLKEHGIKNFPLLCVARVIDRETKASNKRYVAMENALSYMCQVALSNGASAEEMRRVADMVEEGDKA